MKVAIAQIKSEPGQIALNSERIIAAINKARAKKADLLILPELTIPAYCTLDLVLSKDYIRENLEALDKIKENSKGLTVIVGFIERSADDKRNTPELYNAAAVLSDGKLLAIQRKSHLPNYDIFNESRYYTPASQRNIVEIGGKLAGVQICEDLWDEEYAVKVTEELIKKGAEIIINLSASPFHMNKVNERARLIKRYSENNVYFFLANSVGSFDGYDGEIIFDGRSMIYAPGGKLIKIGKSFAEDFLFFDTDAEEPAISLADDSVATLYNALISGMKGYFERNPFIPCVLGLSGGIDSAVVACLAAEALGNENVKALTLPSQYSSKDTLQDARLLAKNLKISLVEHRIDELFFKSLSTLETDTEFSSLPKDITEENLQARIRMLILMAYTNKLGGALLNTGNKTELALGYCTIYGDMAGALSVLGDVDKEGVYKLAQYINERVKKELIPLSTIERPASAELRENQKDSDSLGAPPESLSPLVNDFVENFMSLDSALDKYKDVFSADVINKIFFLIKASEWKRRQAPPAIRVTKKAFGIGRRLPMGI